MRQQAAKWGIVVDAKTSHEKVRQLVIARAIVEHEKQHMAAVDAAWQASATAKPGDHPTTESLAQAEVHALPMAEQDDKAMETAQAEGDALPMAEQDDEAMQTAHAGGPPTEQDKETEQTVPAGGAAAPMVGPPVHDWRNWDLSPPAKPKTLENPAFEGLPSKPRCRHCNTLRDGGRCVDPDCRTD